MRQGRFRQSALTPLRAKHYDRRNLRCVKVVDTLEVDGDFGSLRALLWRVVVDRRNRTRSSVKICRVVLHLLTVIGGIMRAVLLSRWYQAECGG